jgi:HlyD family secretion protein
MFSEKENKKLVELDSDSQEFKSATASRKLSSLGDSFKSKWGLVIGVILGAASSSIVTHLTTLGSPTSAPTPTQSVVTHRQSVTVSSAQITSVTQTISVTGSVAAFDMLPILPQATGLQIQQVLVEEGQTVKAGQVLAMLDNSVLKAQLNQAQADVVSTQAVVQQKQATLAQQQATLAEAQSNLNRYQDLAQAGAVSQKDMDSYVTVASTAREAVNVAQANINSAKADVQSKIAQVQKLETQINQTVVRAPTTGVIAEKIARVGNVTGSEKLFSLIRNGCLELQAKVPETELPQVNIGALARITSDADKRIKLKGRVREIAPLVDSQTRQATVKIDLPPDSLLRLGMFLKAAITVQSTQALTVPALAVLPQTDGQSIVYILEGKDTVRARPVQVGMRLDSREKDQARIVIKSGLHLSDQIVVDGAGYVKDGDRITIVEN